MDESSSSRGIRARMEKRSSEGRRRQGNLAGGMMLGEGAGVEQRVVPVGLRL